MPIAQCYWNGYVCVFVQPSDIVASWAYIAAAFMSIELGDKIVSYYRLTAMTQPGDFIHGNINTCVG